jgi:hypothetical protein
LCGYENKKRLFPYTALTDWREETEREREKKKERKRQSPPKRGGRTEKALVN